MADRCDLLGDLEYSLRLIGKIFCFKRKKMIKPRDVNEFMNEKVDNL